MHCRACAAPRTTTAQAPKAQLKPAPQQPTDTIRRANLRDLADSYLIWADLPGMGSLLGLFLCSFSHSKAISIFLELLTLLGEAQAVGCVYIMNFMVLLSESELHHCQCAI